MIRNNGRAINAIVFATLLINIVEIKGQEKNTTNKDVATKTNQTYGLGLRIIPPMEEKKQIIAPLSNEEIEQKITRLKAYFKKIKADRIAITTIASTLDKMLLVLGVATGLALKSKTDDTTVKFFSEPETTITISEAAAISFAVISENMGSSIAISGPTTFAIIANFNEIMPLINELKKNENLNENQKKIIEALEKELETPAIKGMLQAMAEKNLLDQIIKQTISGNDKLANILGENAESLLQQHILGIFQLKNYNEAIESGMLQKFDPRLALIKFRKWIAEKQQQRRYKKYPQLRTLIEPAEIFINKLNQMRAEFPLENQEPSSTETS